MTLCLIAAPFFNTTHFLEFVKKKRGISGARIDFEYDAKKKATHTPVNFLSSVSANLADALKPDSGFLRQLVLVLERLEDY